MSDNLRLERIRINKLFDRFNYDIDLNNGFDVGILIAPNGCGKTTIFNLIDFIFNPSIQGYRSVVNIPFDFCECTLSNGGVVKLTRSTYQLEDEEPNQEKDLKAILEHEKWEFKRWKINRILGNQTEKNVILDLSANAPRGVWTEINITSFFSESISDLISNEPPDDLDLADLLSNDIDDLHELPENLRSRLVRVSKTLKKYLQGSGCNLNVNYIRADRVYRSHQSIRFSEKGDPLSNIRAMLSYFYKKAINKHNFLQQRMQDNLPKMYLDKKDEDTLDFPTFQQRWNKYLSDIKKYCEIGILPPQEQKTILEMGELEDAFNQKRAFLTVYLEAFAGKETLEPLEELYSRLKLLADILNHRNRITHKVLKYDFYTLNEQEICFEVDGNRLPLECLSSGEKNDLIMFYHLIFDSYYDPEKKINLVLIDEPEISLHITWQHEYIDRLFEICKMNSLQAFVATHSPDIVNGRRLYVKKVWEEV